MKVLFKPVWGIALNGFVLWLLTLFVSEIQYTGGLKFFVLGGIIIGLFNFFIKPLAKLLSLPLIFFSSGFFLVFLNVFVLFFLTYFIGVLEFRDITLVFPNSITYVIGAVVFGIINWGINLLIK